MSLRKNKVAIIGAGEMANEYLKVLSNMRNVDIVGIYNRTFRKSIKLKKKFKIKRAFKKINEMYEISKPDGVIVAISPDKLKYKIQEIFFPNFRYLVEKPIGLNLKESEKIYNFARRKRIQIFVGLNRRFYSSTKYLLRKLKNEFSKNRIIEIEDQQDQIINKKIFSKKILDNYMFVNSIHLIDYFNLLCRGKVIKIKKTSNWISRKKNIFICHLHYSSGDLGIYRSVWNMPGPWSVKAYTRKGFFKLSPIERIYFRKNNSRVDEIIKIDYKNDTKFKPGLRLQIIEFLKSFKNQKNNLPDIEISHELMRLISKIYKKK